MGVKIATTIMPGAGTVVPETSTSTAGTFSGIGLSTQLIIWGMVGFVLLELIAIACLLRYCCRARYMKRKKFKEKEIILSDFTSGTPSIFNKTNNFTSNVILETSHTNFGASGSGSGSGVEINIKNSVNEAQSVNSLKPIYNQNDLNETIMIDDIVSNYSMIQKPKKPTTKPPGSFDMLMNDKTHVGNTSFSSINQTTVLADYRNKMRKQSVTDDIYTFRFASNQPVETFDPNAPIEQHSYLYNGSLNRPAFEIISHADIRPATPVCFEQARDLSIKVPKVNRKFTNEFEMTEHNKKYRPINREECVFKERIYDDGCFESSSWFSNRRAHEHERHHLNVSRSPNRRGRSFTSPVKLNYGNQESIYVKGKPVEWQMARELRTTDWDRLKNYTDNTLHSFYEPHQEPTRYHSINELDHESRYHRSSYSKSAKPERTSSFTAAEYSVPKNKTDNFRKENNIKITRRDSCGENNPHFNGIYPLDDGEQSKSKIYNIEKKNLLDYLSSNSSDISSYNKLNLYKNKLIDNSNYISDEIKNNIVSKKSDINPNSIYEDKWRNTDRRGSDNGRNETMSTTVIDQNNKPTILTKIIRDPDTNEILSKTKINENDLNNTNRYQRNEPENNEDNQLDRSNISVIDVTYNNSPRSLSLNRRLSSINNDDEINDTPPLPPPLQFQQITNDSKITSIINVNNINSRKLSENRLSPILSKRSSSNSNFERSSNDSYTKHANEDFQPSEVLNINQSIYQSKLDSPVVPKSNNMINSFSEKSKKILESSQGSKSNNLFQDIQTFNPGGLRPVKPKVSDSIVYDKIGDSSSNRSSSIVSSNINNIYSNINKTKTPSVIHSETSSSRNDDKNSFASSTHMSKRSSHLY